MLKQLFTTGNKPDLSNLIINGAVIIDVRSKTEYATGHTKGSINIPLDVLQKKLNEIPKNKPIITCCASGMRSATAKNILLQNGFSEVYNGGSWSGL
jgi:rhodanese-related sulfurtransferase